MNTYSYKLEDFCYLHLTDLKRLEKIIFLYPQFLRNNKIMIKNLDHVTDYIYQLLPLLSNYNTYYVLYDIAVFDIEKDEYIDKMEKAQTKINILMGAMNANLSPYMWSVKRNDDTISHCIPEADWYCVLEKINTRRKK